MRETTRELEFPYCSRCVQHSTRWSVASRAVTAVLVGGAIAGAIAGLGLGALIGVCVAAVAIAVAAVVGLTLRARARASCCPACSGPGPAVTYHGWADQVQTFSFSSRKYAAAFAEENERILVNVTPQLYQLLEQRRVSQQQEQTPRPAQLWPQRERLERGRSLLHHAMRINSLMKRSGPGPAS